MQRLTAALLCLFLLCHATALQVWLPERGELAKLSRAGLTAAGERVRLGQSWSDAPLEVPLPSGFARLTFGIRVKQPHLEVLRGGKVVATRPVTSSPYGLWGTQRGPCVADTNSQGRLPTLHCFTPDLKSKWATVTGHSVMFVSWSGTLAYLRPTGWEEPKVQTGYRPDVPFIRYDLSTGQQKMLTYHVPRNAQEAREHQRMFTTYGAQDNFFISTELPGKRFLVCPGMVGLEWECGADIMNRDGKRLLSLQGRSFGAISHVSKGGRRIYMIGNTLQVWDTQTGKKLAHIHNPLWEKRQEGTLHAYLTPDNTQAAIITYHYNPKTGPELNKLTTYIYRLKDSKLMDSFTITEGR